MFSARLVGRLARFHGQRSDTSSGRPSAVNQPATGQLPVASAIARIPSRGMFSTGLPSTQPAARPSQAPAIRSGRSTGGRGGSRISLRQDLVEVLRLLGCERPRDRLELVQQLERERAELVRHRLLRRAAAWCGRSACREPAPLDIVDVLLFLPGLPELVTRSRSSGWTQVTLKQAPRRP